jgi:hypothetical protein
MKTSSSLLVIVWFFLVGSVFCSDYGIFNKLVLPSNVTGPESAAFDLAGEGPYVTVADGRILKWKGPAIGFVDFAYTSPNRLIFLISLYNFFTQHFIYICNLLNLGQYFITNFYYFVLFQ